MVTQDQINKCITIARKYGARQVVLFGSAIDTPATARDIDLLTDGVGGMDFAAMGVEMEDAAGISVDLVPLEPMTRFVRYNLEHGRVLYAA